MTETTKAKKWDDEAVSKLLSLAGNESPVSVSTVEAAAEALGVTVRSVAAKLRQLDKPVASMAKEKVSAFTPEEGAALEAFVKANAGAYTYKELATVFANGKFNNKQIQGKVLALELTGSVKPAEKVEVARTYTEAEEAKFVKMVEAGSFIEEIAVAMGKELPSVRGKALSLLRAGVISKIPAQKESHAKNTVDPVAALGDKLATMTVADIAKASDKTERGIRTILTRRGIAAADYDGAAKKAKAEGKATAKAAA
jgi:hypothetical protein